MHKEITLKRKLIQTLGIRINRIMNFNTALTLPLGETKELIADFRNNWFIVSQMLVRAIRDRIKTSSLFILKPALSLRRLKKQKQLPTV
jgi:hypothetical protein